MQPFSLNEKKWKKAKVVKPLERRSFVVESGGPLYIRNRGFLKRSAEADSPLAEEKPTSLVSDDQPAVERMATTTINQPPVYHCGERGPGPYREQWSIKQNNTPIAMPSSQQASPKGSESQVRTRSGRLVRPPNHFKNCVALKGTNKWRLKTASA